MSGQLIKLPTQDGDVYLVASDIVGFEYNRSRGNTYVLLSSGLSKLVEAPVSEIIRIMQLDVIGQEPEKET
jgi:hypothetical protein